MTGADRGGRRLGAPAAKCEREAVLLSATNYLSKHSKPREAPYIGVARGIALCGVTKCLGHQDDSVFRRVA
jgi:hypothetical protein